MTEDKNFQDLGANLPGKDEDFRKIVLEDDQGQTHDYEVLFTFDSEDYGKSYVVIYPTEDGNNDEINVEVYSYTLDPSGTGTFGNLEPVEDEKELDMAEEILNAFIEDHEFDEGK